VAEICRRLDGIPLAIELAAARVGSLTPEEIECRLDDRFSLLSKGDGSDLSRHQTLSAALDWSYGLLSGPERTLLRRLSVFAGGFDLEAVEAVCQGDEIEAEEVVDVLDRLVVKSLVVEDRNGGSTIRFSLLETIRAYAGERLEEAGETAALRAAHARFYVTLAQRAEPELTGASQERWLDRLESERANMRAALGALTRTLGSVRGAAGNAGPYRDPTTTSAPQITPAPSPSALAAA
jgi:predicted ATPase